MYTVFQKLDNTSVSSDVILIFRSYLKTIQHLIREVCRHFCILLFSNKSKTVFSSDDGLHVEKVICRISLCITLIYDFCTTSWNTGGRHDTPLRSKFCSNFTKNVRKKVKVKHLYNAVTSRICRLNGAVRHRRGRHSAQAAAQARTYGLYKDSSHIHCSYTQLQSAVLMVSIPVTTHVYMYMYTFNTHPRKDGILTWMTYSGQFTQKWSPVNQRSGTPYRSGKVRRQMTDVPTTELRR